MTNFTFLLDIPSLEIISKFIDSKGTIVFTGKSCKTEIKRRKYGKLATKRYGYGEINMIRHHPILRLSLDLKGYRQYAV